MEVTVRATDGYRYDLHSIEVGVTAEIEAGGDLRLYKVPGAYAGNLRSFASIGGVLLTDPRNRLLNMSATPSPKLKMISPGEADTIDILDLL